MKLMLVAVVVALLGCGGARTRTTESDGCAHIRCKDGVPMVVISPDYSEWKCQCVLF